MSRKTRFAVVASHPIPYYAPYYRALVKHAGYDVRACFATRVGIDATLDPGMGVHIAWKTDLLTGYEHQFLPESARILGTSAREVNNPSIGPTLKGLAPDIVLIHGYAHTTALRALAWCRRNGVPALMISDISLHSGTRPAVRLAKRLVLPLLLWQFSAFLSIGDTNQKFLETYGVPRSKIFRVPNMVDEGFWVHRDRRAEERARVRFELGLADHDLAVLYVGKLIPRKRPEDLVAALLALRDLPPTARPVKALFAGDGEQRAALERKAAEAGLPAHFLGFVNIDALPGYFCAADVLSHPAEIETFGVIVLEAAILGLPLVLSDHVGAVGPNSIARPGENALLHPCRDVGALAAYLHRFANEPETLKRLSDASLRISKELDWRQAVAGTVAAVDYCRRDRGRTLTFQPGASA